MNVLFACADVDCIGKFDQASMSDQSRMELVVCTTHCANVFRNSDWDFLPVSQWRGVRLDTCGHVIAIQWRDLPAPNTIENGGSIDFRWLPLTTEILQISAVKIAGKIHTEFLPRSLVNIEVPKNLLSGTFSIESLPEAIKHIDLSMNKFFGTLRISALPRTLQGFAIGYNKFSGGFDFVGLPPNLRALNVEHNQFDGPVDLCALPHQLEWLYMENNNFRQETLVLDNLPPQILEFILDVKCFGKIVDGGGNEIRSPCIGLFV